MSDKEATLLRETMAAIVDAAPTAPAFPTGEARRTHFSGSVLVFAVAFVLMIVVVGSTVVLIGSPFEVADGGSTTQPLESDEAVESPSTTIAPVPAAPISGVVSLPGGWERVPHDEAVFGGEGEQEMLSVTAGGPGLVAVGFNLLGGFSGIRDAAVWTSADGITWSRVAHDPEVFGGLGDQEMQSVTAGGPGLVAVGYRFDEPGRSGVYPGVWISSDGFTWTAVPDDEEGLGRGGAMYDVTAGGPGLVAVGTRSGSAEVWTSPDGISWSSVPGDPQVRGADFNWKDNTTIDSVTVGGPGMVAVGSSGNFAGSDWSLGDNWTHEPGSRHAVVWTSSDGITWTPVPYDEAIFGGSEGQHCRMDDVTVGGPGLVVVGACELFTVESAGEYGLVAHGDLAVVWTSPDGFTWTRVPHNETVFGPDLDVDNDLGMRSVAGLDSGLVAVGQTTWTSPDGISWTRMFGNQAVRGEDIVVGGPGLVVVGSDGSSAVVFTTETDN